MIKQYYKEAILATQYDGTIESIYQIKELVNKRPYFKMIVEKDIIFLQTWRSETSYSELLVRKGDYVVFDPLNEVYPLNSVAEDYFNKTYKILN